jgi:hypothetical protein
MTIKHKIYLDEARQDALCTLKKEIEIEIDIVTYDESRSFTYGSKNWTEKGTADEVTITYLGKPIPFELKFSELRDAVNKHLEKSI